MVDKEDIRVRDRDREGCRIDREILRKARVIAAHEGRGISEVIERLLRGPIERRYAQVAAELGGEGG